jgi:predicted signal transduction protein with EAL and GGDEF domain
MLTMAATMVNMAHTLRKEVVAEGVEREDQYRFLQEIGCEKVQGFLFSEALPAGEMARFALERVQAGLPADSPADSPAEAPAEALSAQAGARSAQAGGTASQSGLETAESM